MIKPLRAILKILQGKIILNNGTDVRIVKREYPIDKTPCITIDNSSSTSIIQKNIINKDYIIPNNHPQYNQNNPNQKISQQVMREERSIDLDLNVWCDDENQRDEITEKILELFYKVQSDYYEYCQNYNAGQCAFLNKACKVNNNTGRGVKKQCPNPIEYNYKNIFKQFDIIRATFDVTPPYILDDLTTNPPVLRSIIRVSFSYYDYHVIGGAISQNLNVDEELV